MRDLWLKLGQLNGEVVSWKDEDGVERQTSYPAAKNYHSLTPKTHREPPTFYLARVSKVFGYNLQWLATGKGPRTPEEAHGQKAASAAELLGFVQQLREQKTDADHMDDLFRGTGAGWLVKQEWVRVRLAQVFGRWYANEERLARVHEQPLPSVDKSAQAFAELLAAPLIKWHVYPQAFFDIHDDRLTAYVEAMVHALSLATPDARDFDIKPHDEEE